VTRPGTSRAGRPPDLGRLGVGVVEMLECREALVNTDELEAAPRWRAGGYCRSRRTCTVRPVMILIASLMMCSISLPILRLLEAGEGCATTRAPRPAGVDG
jgi:hypothetical protein